MTQYPKDVQEAIAYRDDPLYRTMDHITYDSLSLGQIARLGVGIRTSGSPNAEKLFNRLWENWLKAQGFLREEPPSPKGRSELELASEMIDEPEEGGDEPDEFAAFMEEDFSRLADDVRLCAIGEENRKKRDEVIAANKEHFMVTDKRFGYTLFKKMAQVLADTTKREESGQILAGLWYSSHDLKRHACSILLYKLNQREPFSNYWTRPIVYSSDDLGTWITQNETYLLFQENWEPLDLDALLSIAVERGGIDVSGFERLQTARGLSLSLAVPTIALDDKEETYREAVLAEVEKRSGILIQRVIKNIYEARRAESDPPVERATERNSLLLRRIAAGVRKEVAALVKEGAVLRRKDALRRATNSKNNLQ